MEKTKAVIALLMTFVLLIGIVTPCFADEGVTEPYSEESTEQYDEAVTEPSTSEIATEISTEAGLEDSGLISGLLSSLFGSDSGESTDEATVGESYVAEETDGSEISQAEETETETTTEPVTEKVWSSIPFINNIYKNGIPAITTQGFTAVYRTVKSIANILQGRFLWNDDDIFDVTVDEEIVEICQYMTDNTCLDVPMILTNLPDLTEPAKIVNTIFPIDVTEMREELYAESDELYSTDKKKADFLHFVGAYMSGIESAYIYLQPYKDVYEIAIDVTYSDGAIEKFKPGIVYNPETGDFYGKSDKGIMSIGFNSNVEELFVYAPMYCWMRNMGFCIEYDILCYILPVYCYNTRRIKFDYNGKEWMVQMWKGNYLITNGGEIGVYNREPGSIGTYYDCISDDELLPMSLKVIHGNDVLVNVEETPHWWVNGFKLGNRLYSPHSLTLIGTITLDNEEMLEAFCDGIDNNIYHDIDYTVDGLKVTFIWDT